MSSTPRIAVSAQHLSVAYQDVPVLKNVAVDIPTGCVMGIVGPNGAGKSTLLKSFVGLVTPLTGKVEIFGQPLKNVRQQVAYMPQSNSVDWDFPTTVEDVVMMGTYSQLGWFRRPGKKERQLVEHAMAMTDITDLAHRSLNELSGGQRQRVFLARALANTADVFFLDEPFQGVDAVSQEAIVRVLHMLRDEGKTVVLVHHDLATVTTYCDHVTLINERIISSGPVEAAFTQETIDAAYRAGAVKTTVRA